jgi:hypothetical protein
MLAALVSPEASVLGFSVAPFLVSSHVTTYVCLHSDFFLQGHSAVGLGPMSMISLMACFQIYSHILRDWV